MPELATVGVDLARNVFQVHGVDENGRVLVRRQVRRGQLETSNYCRFDIGGPASMVETACFAAVAVVSIVAANVFRRCWRSG